MTALDKFRKEKLRAFQKRSATLLLLLFGTAYLAWILPTRFVKPTVEMTTLP